MKDRLCGCGVPVGKCDFWRSVLTDAFGDPDVAQRSAKEIDEWRKSAVRFRHLTRVLRESDAGPHRWKTLDRYLDSAGRLYKALAHVAGARVVVDSSKHPTDAAILRLLPGVRPYHVHLVRDPRAVAYSWQRQKSSPGDGPRDEMMRLTAATSAKSWVVVNVAAEAVRRREPPNRSILVRYESFVAHPKSTVERILRLLGEETQDLPFDDDHRVTLTPGHTAGGNPNRFSTGPILLREDTEWLHGQSRGDRLISTAITLPLLRRYRYPVMPERGR